MPFAMSIACFQMNMTFEEALAAATLNAAWSIDRSADIGSIETGKMMDAVLVRGDAINLIRNGAPSIAAVIKRGRIVRGGDQETVTGEQERGTADQEIRRNFF
jgi:imidazolonepropionase